MVEFALILVLLLIIVLGIMEFGIILYNRAMLTNGGREGARAGVVFRADPANFAYAPLTAAEIRTVVGNYIQTRLVTFGTQFNPATDVTPMWSTDNGSTWTSSLPTTHGNGEQLRVDVTFTYSYLALPGLKGVQGPSLAMTSRTIMRME